MTQKIYFGSIEITNPKTRERRTIDNQVFKELDYLDDNSLKKQVLRKIQPKERKNWQVSKLCYSSAKCVGNTLY